MVHKFVDHKIMDHEVANYRKMSYFRSIKKNSL